MDVSGVCMGWSAEQCLTNQQPDVTPLLKAHLPGEALVTRVKLSAATTRVTTDVSGVCTGKPNHMPPTPALVNACMHATLSRLEPHTQCLKAG